MTELPFWMSLYGLDRVRPRNIFKNVFSDLISVGAVAGAVAAAPAVDNRIVSVSK